MCFRVLTKPKLAGMQPHAALFLFSLRPTKQSLVRFLPSYIAPLVYTPDVGTSKKNIKKSINQWSVLYTYMLFLFFVFSNAEKWEARTVSRKGLRLQLLGPLSRTLMIPKYHA